MDKDPKIFYDYIKEQNRRDNAVGPFKKEKKYMMPGIYVKHWQINITQSSFQ